jgi:hypothetical protein
MISYYSALLRRRCLVNMKLSFFKKLGFTAFWLAVVPSLWADPPRELGTGIAEYAFDHLGSFHNLSEPAAASGVTVIYCGGVGVNGYQAMPDQEEFARERRDSLAYIKQARTQGIRLAIGYLCATSIVDLKSWDKNWTPQFRARFHTPPAQWRQLDKTGHVLSSWYPAPYEPACMNNPDWRAYEKFMIQQQFNSGCDGIFFDNPAVHQNGCYCPFCMDKFDAFLAAKPAAPRPDKHSFESLRRWAIGHPAEFLEFRSTIAADFLTDMRTYARSINSHALITCNNSLNSPDALFSQCRSMGYNIHALSRAEDFITVEDMGSQAHKSADGRVFEYGPTYKQLHAISHGKPIVACTLAEGDYYHISPDLARLSMAEAAANDASWLLWPAWPKSMRQAAAASILPEAELLRRNEKLLNHAAPRCDVLLFLSFHRWLETDHCAASAMAAALGQANIQFAVCSEENLAKDIASATPLSPVLLIESFSVMNEAEKQAVETFKLNGGQVVAGDQKDWMGQLRQTVAKPSIVLRGPSTLRVVVRDQPKRAIVHLYNLDVQRLSSTSFEDQVHPAQQIGLTLRVPFRRVRSVRALTSDTGSTRGALEFTARPDGKESVVEMTYPKLEISTILVVEP